MFCPECRSLMFPKDGVFSCKKCGHSSESDGKAKVVKYEATEKEMLIIEEELQTLPKARVECTECGNLEAFYHIRQTRAADEPSTRFYRCTKCKHTWREY